MPKKQPAVLVIDCGATNIRAVAINSAGKTLAQAGEANEPVRERSAAKGWFIWDLERLWKIIGGLARKVVRRVGATSLKAVTVTTWGADGTTVDEKGRLTHPLIAWR